LAEFSRSNPLSELKKNIPNSEMKSGRGSLPSQFLLRRERTSHGWIAFPHSPPGINRVINQIPLGSEAPSAFRSVAICRGGIK
jgi:hypothetical protein